MEEIGYLLQAQVLENYLAPDRIDEHPAGLTEYESRPGQEVLVTLGQDGFYSLGGNALRSDFWEGHPSLPIFLFINVSIGDVLVPDRGSGVRLKDEEAREGDADLLGEPHCLPHLFDTIELSSTIRAGPRFFNIHLKWASTAITAIITSLR